MEIQDFRLFLEVIESGSFTKVAAQRQTVQSHISRQVSDLERRCGSPLFRRTGRGVVLTEFGRHVEQRVRNLLNAYDAVFADIREIASVPMGEVKLAVLPSAAHPLMSHVFDRLQRDFPRITLNIREGQGGELDALLDTGSVDMAILFRFDKPRSPDEVLLATANTYLAVHPDSPLARSDTLEFRRLANIPLVLPRRPSHWRAILDETARSQGIQLTPVIEADSLRLQRQVLRNNPHLGAVLGTFSIDDDVTAGRLKAIKIVAPDLKRYVTLAHPKQGALTPASRCVSELIVATMQEWGHQLSPPTERCR